MEGPIAEAPTLGPSLPLRVLIRPSRLRGTARVDCPDPEDHPHLLTPLTIYACMGYRYLCSPRDRRCRRGAGLGPPGNASHGLTCPTSIGDGVLRWFMRNETQAGGGELC